MMTDTAEEPAGAAPDRLEALIDAYLEGELGAEEAGELSEALLSSAMARDLFWRMARHQLRIERWARESWGAAAAVADVASEATDRFRSGFGFASRFRRLRADSSAALFAFGAACGIVGAGAALAITPIPLQSLREPIPLVNPGFEAPIDRSDHGLSGRPPLVPGEWSGDVVRSVAASCGVVPHDGKRMLAFAKGLPDPPGTGNVSACDLFQVVDLRPFVGHASADRTAITLSAWFQRAATARSLSHEHSSLKNETTSAPAALVATARVTCRIFVFSGNAEPVAENWPLAINSAIASGYGVADLPPPGPDTGGGWMLVKAETLVPPSATFALMHLSAESQRRPTGESNTCPIAFCDDVRAEFVTHDAARASRGAYYWALMTGQDIRPGPPHRR